MNLKPQSDPFSKPSGASSPARFELDLRRIWLRFRWLLTGGMLLLVGLTAVLVLWRPAGEPAEVPMVLATEGPVAAVPSPAPTTVPTRTPTEVPPPTPLPKIPLVWSRNHLGSELFTDVLSGIVLERVPNGTEVLLLNAEFELDGVIYARVEAGLLEGWMQRGDIYLAVGPPQAWVSILSGANLRIEPEGTILGKLPYGTPVQRVLQSQSVNALYWQEVQLLDGQAGWVAASLLSPWEGR